MTSEEKYTALGTAMESAHGTVSSQMFGKPCLKINGKAFCAYFKGDMAFKIGRENVEILKEKYTGSVSWDPSGKGRPMKDWLQVPAEFIEAWEELSREAMEFVVAMNR